MFVGTTGAVAILTGIVEGIAYGAHVSPAPLVTPYFAYISSFSSTSNDVWRDSKKYCLPSPMTSLRIASSRCSRSSASVGHTAAGLPLVVTALLHGGVTIDSCFAS